MSAKTDLRGKSRDEIAELTKNWRRDRFVDALYELANIEDFFTPVMVGRARRMTATAIVKRCKSGEIRAHKPLDNGWRIPASAVREWDERTAFQPTGKSNGAS